LVFGRVRSGREVLLESESDGEEVPFEDGLEHFCQEKLRLG
jgi:hypothetical protein